MKFHQQLNLRFLIGLTIFSFCSITIAENMPKNYKTMKIEALTLININKNQFHNYWDSKPGTGVSVSFPYSKGNFKIGILYRSFVNRGTEHPPFKTIFGFAQWGFDIFDYKFLSFHLGVRTGLTNIHFDISDITTGDDSETESEIECGIQFCISIKMNKSISINTSLLYQKMFTQHRIELFYIASGFSYQLSTPAWMQDILQ